jgi:N utilization substance protein B
MQALYQWQVTGQAGQDVALEFLAHRLTPGVDEQFFRELVTGATEQAADLDAMLAELADRPVSQLDPVEHAILLVGLFELKGRVDVPWRAVITEAVELCKRYGAADGHRYVNAILDRAARQYRVLETGAAG